MELKEIYYRCGLSDPDLFEKQIKTKSLFYSVDMMREIIGNNRSTGKSTKIMMMAIQNVFDNKTTLIATHSGRACTDFCMALKKHVRCFPELDLSWYSGTSVQEFVGTTNNRNRILVANYVSVSERNIVARARHFDIEYLDY